MYVCEVCGIYGCVVCKYACMGGRCIRTYVCICMNTWSACMSAQYVYVWYVRSRDGGVLAMVSVVVACLRWWCALVLVVWARTRARDVIAMMVWARARGVLVLVPCSWYARVLVLVVCARTRARAVLAMMVCLLNWLGFFCFAWAFACMIVRLVDYIFACLRLLWGQWAYK